LTIGLKLGVLPPAVYTMLFLMALATTAMTVPILRLHGYGKRSNWHDAAVIADADGISAKPGEA